ncbi:MAG TPA: HAMP domain-containing sensor histidine kinase [Longimicrobiaceae bacterium]|nr:HAMP domain-containing sensor histidine kinase [Longimicrobiaceae bacterium]
MKLRDRFLLTLAVMTLVLLAPAVYGLFALRELRTVAYNLSTRDAVGALALGRLQTAFSEVESEDRIFMAFAESPPSDRTAAGDQVARQSALVERELHRLSTGGYATATRLARETWNRLDAAIALEHRLVDAGRLEEVDSLRSQVVLPSFDRMDAALDPIGTAINQAGRTQVEHAQAVASRAATTVLLALAIALVITLLVGAWVARGLIVPIQQLRRAMGEVAAGELEPEVEIATSRPDEIGDLNRSFALMTEQLAELDRLKAEFVSVASHELKTPLSVIKGYLSLLDEGIYGDIPEEQEKILSSIGKQADQLGVLVQQLLDISRFEAGGGRLHLQTIDPAEFLREISETFEALAVQNEIDFELLIDPSLPDAIEGDPDRLREVVGNLLSNAFKFTPRHGRIELRAHAAAGGDDESPVQGVEISVSDTGVGIPQDQLSRIFDKFYQVENAAQPMSVGSGLGLAISREIVEAHGGTIAAESELGKGTTFRVFLPLAPPSQATT